MAFLDEHGLEYYDSKIKEYIGSRIGEAIGGVTQIRFEVVSELPETGEVGVIYLKPLTASEPSNLYDEFIWVEDSYEFLGTTETDLSNYYNKGEVDGLLNNKQNTITDLENIRSGASLGATALQSYTETDPTVPEWAKASTKPAYTASEVGAYTTAETNTLLSNKQDVISDLETIRSGAALGATALQEIPDEYVTEDELATALEKKQNTLTQGANIILENDTISADLTGYLTKELADNTYAPLVETEIVYEGDLDQFKQDFSNTTIANGVYVSKLSVDTGLVKNTAASYEEFYKSAVFLSEDSHAIVNDNLGINISFNVSTITQQEFIPGYYSVYFKPETSEVYVASATVNEAMAISNDISDICYIRGSIQSLGADWNVGWNMYQLPDGTYTFAGVKLVPGDEFKVVYNNSWYPDNAGNLVVSYAGIYDIYFNPQNGDISTHLSHFGSYYIDKKSTAFKAWVVDNTAFIVDGQNGLSKLTFDRGMNLQETVLTKFKTINGSSVLGEGNIEISGGGSDLSNYYTIAEADQLLLKKQNLLTPGDETITINENNTIVANIPDVDLTGYATETFVTNITSPIDETLTQHIHNQDMHVTAEEKELWNTISSIPTEQNELIYSTDGQTYSTLPLMYTEGLVVDTEEDLQLCKNSANISMSQVISSWTSFGNVQADKNAWGYCDSSADAGSQTVTLVGGDTQSVPVQSYNNKAQGYIFNTLNTTALTGYYSTEKYSSYDSKTAAGILGILQAPTATDYMAIVPALNDEDGFCGISISVNNTYGTGSDGRESVGGAPHTISVVAWSQDSPDQLVKTAVTEGVYQSQILTNEEGLSIIPHNSNYCNGTSSGTASVIQVHVRRRNDIITFWASEAYPTSDDDYNYRNAIHYDRPVEIDLKHYTLTFTDSNGVTTVKDLSQTTEIVAIFDKLQTSAKRGYEACSNPGSIYRNCSEDEMILNIISDQNEVFKYDGENWVQDTTVTPLQLFQTGSRLAWNRVTQKLFYNDGLSIYCISKPSSSEEFEYTLPAASSSTLGGIKVGDNLVINDGVLSVSGDFTGPQGDPGVDGESITITSTTSSTEDGGANTVTFSDGTVLTVYNGNTGSDATSIEYEQGQNISIQNGEISALGYVYDDTSSTFDLGVNTLIIGERGVDTINVDSGALKIYGDANLKLQSDDSINISSAGDTAISCGGGLDITAEDNVTISGSGSCTINSATAINNQLTVLGSVSSTGGFFQTSDVTKKNIISDLDLNKAYDLIDKCQTILYTLKSDDENKVQVGMIAQEVQEIFPELICESTDGTLALDYSRLTVIILKVLKDLIVRIQTLEEK